MTAIGTRFRTRMAGALPRRSRPALATRWNRAVALEGCLHTGATITLGCSSARYTLGAGHAHVVETSGWWHLHADGRIGAHVRIVAATARTQRPAWSAMWRWLANVVQPRQTSRG
ncbi:hypothetical protein ACU4HD_48265 [Cupriavidus basilensis]